MRKAVSVSFRDTPYHVQCLQNQATVIAGRVVIYVYDRVEIVGISIELNGECQSNPLPTADVPNSAWTVNHYTWEIIVNNLRATDRQQVHLGRHEESGISHHVEGNRVQPHILHDDFNLFLDRRVPESWAGNKGRNASVTYVLKAEVRYRRYAGLQTVEKETATQNITLRNSFCLATLDVTSVGPYLQSNMGSRMMRIARCLWGKGSNIFFSIRLPYSGFVCGEYIPAVVYISNKTSRTIRSVSLHFLQVFTIRSRNHPADVLEVTQDCSNLKMEKVLPRSAWHRLVLGLKVPENCRTDGSFPACPLISVRFLVRLKLQCLWFNTFTCDVACHVGTERSRSGHPVVKAVVNEERLALFPPDFRNHVKEADLPFTILEAADSW